MKLKDIKRSYEQRPNYFLLPVYKTADYEEYNALLNEVMKLKGFKKTKFKRTRSKALCTDRKILWHEMPGYEIKQNKIGCEIIILSYTFGHCRIQFRPTGNKEADENKINGRQAFNKFKKDCEKYDINLDDYMVPEEVGWEIKQTIEKPKIDVSNKMVLNKTFEHVNHLDINSSYPAGLAESHPEFAPLIQKYFDKRKTNKDYKAILNLTIGFMQSTYVDYRLSQLSRDAIHINNKKVEEMTQWLRKNGRIVLLWNTDGIWFAGESVKDIFNSTQLGEWHEDYTDCKFRAKSAGCYEFICNGKYEARVRGKTKFEETKPRNQWEWGDIYQEATDEIIKYFHNSDGTVTRQYISRDEVEDE